MAAMVSTCVVFCLCIVYVSCEPSYTREELLHIGCSTPPDILPTLLTHSTDILDILVPVRWTRRQRGKRGGSHPSLPGIFLCNVNSLPNKMKELRLLVSRDNDFKSTAVFAFVETHLKPTDPDGAVQLEGFSALRADRDFEAVGKSH